MTNSTAKIISILCGLTILSGCSTDDEWKREKVTAQRHAPTVNNQMVANGVVPAIPPAPSGNYMAMPQKSAPMPPMPVMPPAPIPQTPQLITQETPPLGSLNSAPVAPTPPVTSMPLPPAAPLPNDRRPPEFNRQALGVASNQGFAPVPSAKAPSAPVIPQPPEFIPMKQPAQMADSSQPAAPQLPPRAPGYPSLGGVPPSPPAPQPAQNDPRVQQMKQDLADMQQQKAIQQGQPPKVIVRSVSTGGLSMPQVQQLSNNAPVNGNPPVAMRTTQMPLPGAAPTPPVPPSAAIAPQAQQPQVIASATPANQGLMPIGPTVVIHSNKSMAAGSPPAPYAPPAPVVASAAPQAPTPPQTWQAPTPPQAPKPWPMANAAPQAPLPPQAPVMLPPANPGSRNLASLPPAPPPPPAEIPMAAPSPKVASAALPPQIIQPTTLHTSTATTSATSLRPIPVQPVGPGVTYASAAPQGYTNPASLQPIASNNGYRPLPESRYAKFRRASNNSAYANE